MPFESHPEKTGSIQSPFSSTEGLRPPSRKKAKNARQRRIVIGAMSAAIICAGAGFVALNYLNEPYRNLEDFPTAKYFDSFESLEGLKFRMDGKVEANLGWKDGVGRLMVFVAGSDSRPLSVLVPSGMFTSRFDKGQTYKLAVEVKDGGVIVADSIHKQ